MNNKWTDRTLAVAALTCVALMLARAANVFQNGPYVYTSGAEEESLFAVWKWWHQQAVYANPFEPPFAQSYFNWLFYWVYGAFSWAVISITKLDSSALPAIGRYLTLALTITTGLAVYGLLKPLSSIRRIAGSAIIAFNPLIGFWSVTTRPDVGALACALVGLWCIGKSEQAQSSVWLGAGLSAVYCSWAFKQSYVAAFAAVFLHFVLTRKWWHALLFGGGAAVAIGATLFLGTPGYKYAMIRSQSHVAFSASIASFNIGKALLKAPMFLFGLISVIFCIRRNPVNLPVLWALISVPLMLIASAKAGASDNYFFEPVTICSIVFLLRGRYLIAGAVAQVVAPMLIVAGVAGTLFLKPKPELASLKSELTKLSGSVFVTELPANLPWFQERPPHFVLAYTYGSERALGQRFAFGGIEGMVRTGRIEVFVCPRDKVNEPFDGIIPSSLRKVKAESNWVYFATQPAN